MTTISLPDPNLLREQVLRLSEMHRAELVSALLDSLRPPESHQSEVEMAREIELRSEAYHRGELESIDLDESVNLARKALQPRPPT